MDSSCTISVMSRVQVKRPSLHRKTGQRKFLSALLSEVRKVLNDIEPDLQNGRDDRFVFFMLCPNF